VCKQATDDLVDVESEGLVLRLHAVDFSFELANDFGIAFLGRLELVGQAG
jgi:hypothetical protein